MIIWLQGPSGAGKTTTGRALARLLGAPFVDLDEEIEREAGKSAFDIVWNDGEAVFRRLEWNAFLAVANNDDEKRVVALGGGAVVDPAVRSTMRSTGVRVFIDVEPEAALARLEADTPRPLLFEEDPEAAWRRLYRSRARYYADTDLTVISAADPEQVAAEIAAGLAELDRPDWICETVLGGEPCRVESYRALWVLMERLREIVGDRRLCMIADEAVTREYEEQILADDQGTLHLALESEEESKSLRTVERYAAALASSGFTRDGVIAGIGGGVVTDLSGFLASIYMRGVESLYVPTTLLAQVDAAIGGKTAVNAAGARNLLGTVRQPAHVLISTAFLRTLPRRELRSGFVECVKMGIANSAELAAAAERAMPAILEGEIPANIDELVRLSVETKLGVVERDTHDRSLRMSLNLGHTFGHALEGIEPGVYAHGEAVAFGLIAAAGLARSLGVIGAERNDRIAELALPLTLATGGAHDVGRLLAAMSADKKREERGLRFVLPTEETGFEIRTVGDPELLLRTIERTFTLIEEYHSKAS